MDIEEVRKNKSAKRLNFHKGSLSHSPSQTNGDTKVQINSEIAIPKLQKLAETYFGVSDPHRFLTDLRVALGIPDSQGASKYGVVSIPKEDGSILQASLRVTNHQANANTYIDHDANYKYNLSIVVRRKQRKNTFIPNENVILDEYVYYGTKMQNVENPLTQIVNGIIVFLQSGEYKDTTGIAFKNQSVESKDRVPQNISVDNDGNYVSANDDGADYVSENNKYKYNRINMKKRIRLTESDLHRIVNKSVKRAINEGWWGNMKGALQGAYNGYQASKSASDAQQYRQQIRNNGGYISQDSIVNSNLMIPNLLNDLYQNVGWLADDWKNSQWKRGGRALKNLQQIKNDITQIEGLMQQVEPEYQQANRIRRMNARSNNV